MNITKLSVRFQTFAEECKGSSRLYEVLSNEIAKDEELLSITADTRIGQPVPNMLFGAVQYMLLKNADHELKRFYRSMVEKPRPATEAFPYFKDFCFNYRSEISDLLKSKLVQTNEVRRCAYLYPAFCYVYEKIKKPLALIEIGTSAGFQLLWDTYAYSYGSAEIYGNTQADIVLEAEVREGKLPDFMQSPPPVSKRIGLDLHINNVKNSEDRLWLKALIWPEHVDRRDLFDKVASQVQAANLQLIEGDGVAMLPELVNEISSEMAVVVFHTHVANQFSNLLKEELLQQIHSIGSKRDIFHLYNNMYDRYLHLDYYLQGGKVSHIVGETEGHGRWFTWNLSGK
ncbi:DUF2332 domain-containing protein [Virgibacillus halodenitrificans]|uniref:DUF2332 domain-containing protein n=1 Tax=Virgibacillus halodenitrificans TaxID=1482 RepID=UPI002DB6B885|nr:DUF2332 domain-containing protein [Virgibacillus halodenitrificans]MEC2158684.1 DUF2332 domain-containing protein [Virgibacillus halodenitrificans]